MVGQVISHYRILDKLGEGGMGVVYKAEDTRLERTVALKFLAAHLLDNDEAKERFLREAKAAAALNHPNICHVYEIDEAEAKTFISMAFVEGETLDDRISRGPLPIKDALDIGQQIAKGLEAAHEKSIVHRDVKPANALVASDGQVTIMDFGLARLTEASRLTKADTTMGTVAYMSPEQTEGSGTDHRTDIWSLGVVLYEMVTGQQPFKGDYDRAVMYSILNEEPEPITALRTGVPMELERIVGKCLAKDAADRYQRANEIGVDLRTLAEKLKSGRSTIVSKTRVAPAAQPEPDNVGQTGGSQLLPWLICAILGALAASFGYLHLSESAQEARVRRFSITPAGSLYENALQSGVAISPDGMRVAYATAGETSGLWIQDLGRGQPHLLADTEGAYLPFWSPESNVVGFAAQRALKKVALDGGSPITLCPLPEAGTLAGATWSPDGDVVVFSSGNALYEVPSIGGSAELLIPPGSESTASEVLPIGPARPHFLPREAGSRVLLYSFGQGTSDRRIAAHDLKTGRHSDLGPGSHPFYSSSGHVIYQRDYDIGDLWAMPFSLESLEATSSPFLVAQGGRGATIATDQSLAYLDDFNAQLHQLVWLDRTGRKLGEIGRPQANMREPALSPDEQFIAVGAGQGPDRDIWIWDIARGVSSRALSPNGGGNNPTWSPDGKWIAFDHNSANGDADTSVREIGGSEVRTLVARPNQDHVSDWSGDGEYIVSTLLDTTTAADIWRQKRDENGHFGEPQPLLKTEFYERIPHLSPDGKYFVYSSNESGRFEIYIRSYPDAANKVTVSRNGGGQCRWSRDGKEILYVEGKTLMSVRVTTSPSLTVGKATPLFEHPSLQTGIVPPQYDVSSDGKRFVLPEPVEADESWTTSIRIVLNWYEEFRDRE